MAVNDRRDVRTREVGGHSGRHYDLKIRILNGGGYRVGDFAVLVHVNAAVRRNSQRKLRAKRNQKRHQSMVEQIGSDASGVIPVLAPAEVAILAECALRRRAQETLPVDVVFNSLGVDLVFPFAVYA